MPGAASATGPGAALAPIMYLFITTVRHFKVPILFGFIGAIAGKSGI